MALPQVEQGVIDLVKEDEAEQKREAALAAVNGNEAPAEAASETAAPAAEATVVEDNAKQAAEPAKTLTVAQESRATAVAAVAQGNADAMGFLAEQGFDDLKLNFSSFPTVTLNNEKFNTNENKGFGTRFECVIMQQGKQFLYRGDTGKREDEPELVYSDDGVYNNAVEEDGTRKPVAWYIEDWKKRGMNTGVTEYKIIYVQMVDSDDNPHSGEVCRVQIPPASRAKLDGYLTQLGWKKISPRDVVTEISVGPTLGSGTKAFNPFVFKQVRKAV